MRKLCSRRIVGGARCQTPRGYSLEELHAYAMARNYPEEAETLLRYLKLRQRSKRRNMVDALQGVLTWGRGEGGVSASAHHRRDATPRRLPAR